MPAHAVRPIPNYGFADVSGNVSSLMTLFGRNPPESVRKQLDTLAFNIMDASSIAAENRHNVKKAR